MEVQELKIKFCVSTYKILRSVKLKLTLHMLADILMLQQWGIEWLSQIMIKQYYSSDYVSKMLHKIDSQILKTHHQEKLRLAQLEQEVLWIGIISMYH